ncbi:hypothetical protein LTR27_000903 [Elasticomyces elasticus]|nr:hypothetical protein LTR27_000903 [Elasticomyces elasticus]
MYSATPNACVKGPRSTTSSINQHANKAIFGTRACLQVEANTTKDTVLRISETVSKATGEGARWVADSVINYGVLSGGVSKTSSPDANQLMWLGYIIQQASNYTSPALNYTSEWYGNLCAGDSVNIGLESRLKECGTEMGSQVPATRLPLDNVTSLNTRAKNDKAINWRRDKDGPNITHQHQRQTSHVVESRVLWVSRCWLLV